MNEAHAVALEHVLWCQRNGVSTGDLVEALMLPWPVDRREPTWGEAAAVLAEVWVGLKRPAVNQGGEMAEFTPGQAAVMRIIRRCCREGREIPRNSRLAEVAGCSRGHLTAMLRGFRDRGLIHQEFEGNPSLDAECRRRITYIPDGTVSAWSLHRDKRLPSITSPFSTVGFPRPEPDIAARQAALDFSAHEATKAEIAAVDRASTYMPRRPATQVMTEGWTL